MRRALLAVLFCACASPGVASDIAITFDDLPSHSALPPGETRTNIAATIIAALKDAHAPPIYGFVNALRLKDDPPSAPVLGLWRDAGFPLGNHTWSHMNLNTHDASDWLADMRMNEAPMATHAGSGDWHWLRFPYLAEGETAAKHLRVRRALAASGYRIAPVTMSFDDYLWNEPYARCVAKGDSATIARLETAWLAAADGSLTYYRDLSLALYGREIPYVLLMHLGAFDAHMLPRLLELYRARGVHLVSLPDAVRDPFYAATDPNAPPGPETLEQAAAAQGITHPGRVVRVLAFDTLCR